MAEFVCPSCTYNRLEEIMVDVVVASIVDLTMVDDGAIDGYIGYSEQTNDGGVIDRFQCVECGYVLRDQDGKYIEDYEGLSDWLKKEKNDDSKVS